MPYAGKSVHYTVSGANPQSGAVTLNSAGQAQISYVGHNAGIDTTQLFVDLTGTGTQTAGDPSGTASVTFLPLPPTPNSSYKVQSVKANSNGTITITFVPAQSGQATLEVTVPTASISRREAVAAKHRKAKGCKKGQTKIKGKCRPTTTVSGKVSASGVGGVRLTLTVKPSSKVAGAAQERKDGPPHGEPHLQVLARRQTDRGGLPRDGQRQEAQEPQARQALARPSGRQVCRTGRHLAPRLLFRLSPADATPRNPLAPKPAPAHWRSPPAPRPSAALLPCIQWP